MRRSPLEYAEVNTDIYRINHMPQPQPKLAATTSLEYRFRPRLIPHTESIVTNQRHDRPTSLDSATLTSDRRSKFFAHLP